MRKRILGSVMVLIAILSALIVSQGEHFSITIFERRWTHRLKTIQTPEEMAEMFRRHEAGDYFQKRYSDDEWLVGVSTSSCGNGLLPDMLLIRDNNGAIHKVTDDHMCGKGGILMAIPELDSNSYQVALSAIAARNKRHK